MFSSVVIQVDDMRAPPPPHKYNNYKVNNKFTYILKHTNIKQQKIEDKIRQKPSKKLNFTCEHAQTDNSTSNIDAKMSVV